MWSVAKYAQAMGKRKSCIPTSESSVILHANFLKKDERINEPATSSKGSINKSIEIVNDIKKSRRTQRRRCIKDWNQNGINPLIKDNHLIDINEEGFRVK